MKTFVAFFEIPAINMERVSNLHPTGALSVVSGKQSAIWDFLSQQWQLAISLHVRE